MKIHHTIFTINYCSKYFSFVNCLNDVIVYAPPFEAISSNIFDRLGIFGKVGDFGKGKVYVVLATVNIFVPPAHSPDIHTETCTEGST